jgi:hypothetical protein
VAEGHATIPSGWCDFGDVYRHWVRVLPDEAVIVEVGSYLGQSALHFGLAARHAARALRLICIDPWKGVPEQEISDPGMLAEQRRVLREHAGSMRPAFMRAISAHGLHPWVDAREMTSVAAAATFAPESVDRVMLDGSHAAEDVRADLEAWWPTLKPGGELVGHDDDWPSVHDTVRAWAQAEGRPVLPLSKRCWRVIKPAPHTAWTTPAPGRTCLVALCSNERTIGRQTVESLLNVLSPHRVLAAMRDREFAHIEARWYAQHPGVDTLREVAALDAVRGLFSHVLFLDADMTWPVTLLSQILGHHDRGIVSGLYHLKQWPHQPVAFRGRAWNADDQWWEYTYDVGASLGTALRPEDLIGLGCALIPVRAFEAQRRPWFQYQRSARTGLLTATEDVWFCEWARAAGVPIWLDPRISCGHVAQHQVTEQDRFRAEFDLAHLRAGTVPALPEERQERAS